MLLSIFHAVGTAISISRSVYLSIQLTQQLSVIIESNLLPNTISAVYVTQTALFVFFFNIYKPLRLIAPKRPLPDQRGSAIVSIDSPAFKRTKQQWILLLLGPLLSLLLTLRTMTPRSEIISVKYPLLISFGF